MKLLLVGVVWSFTACTFACRPHGPPCGPVECLDSGVDAGPDGGDVDAGPPGWRFAVRELPDTARYWNSSISALSASGAIAGIATKGLAQPPVVFLVDQTFEDVGFWPFAVPGIATIRALADDGTYCGSAYWNDPIFGPNATVGTAALGRDGGVARILPDPVSGECLTMNSHGATAGEWGLHNFYRDPDGGVMPLDLFFLPDGGVNLLKPVSMNDRNEVVGWLSCGACVGQGGNPTGVIWRPGAPPRLLMNRDGYAAPNHINNKGLVVGVAISPAGNRAAAMWTAPDTQPTYLPLPDGIVESEALASNEAGLIVGYGLDAHASHGIIWWRSRAYLADDLVGGLASAPIEWLGFVNAKGRIAGNTQRNQLFPDGGLQARPRQGIVIDVLQYPNESALPDGG